MLLFVLSFTICYMNGSSTTAQNMNVCDFRIPNK